MTLKQQINEDMKAALKNKESERLNTIRLLLAAVKEREIADRQAGERVDLDDANIIAVIEKMIKQRRDSIEQFQSAGRSELAEKEHAELKILETYLPSPLSEAELNALIDQAIQDSQATQMKDMGKVMAALKPQIQGRADIGTVSAKIKQRLNG